MFAGLIDDNHSSGWCVIKWPLMGMYLLLRVFLVYDMMCIVNCYYTGWICVIDNTVARSLAVCWLLVCWQLWKHEERLWSIQSCTGQLATAGLYLFSSVQRFQVFLQVPGDVG